MALHTLRSELVKARVSTVWVALLVTALLVPWAFSAVLFGLSEFPQELPTTQWGYRFGILPIAALGALAISSELQSGSAAFTFTATPERWRPLSAKAVVLVLASIPVGLIAGGGSWLIAWLLQGMAARHSSSYRPMITEWCSAWGSFTVLPRFSAWRSARSWGVLSLPSSCYSSGRYSSRTLRRDCRSSVSGLHWYCLSWLRMSSSLASILIRTGRCSTLRCSQVYWLWWLPGTWKGVTCEDTQR